MRQGKELSMNPIWLIMSSAFIEQELAAEFGRIPPSFLPVGNARLYEHQKRLIGEGVVYLTLPESYTLSPFDEGRLSVLGIEVLHIPDGLSLGAAIVFAINIIGDVKDLRILHGDTLVLDYDLGSMPSDTIGVTHGFEGYSWAVADVSEGSVRSVKTVEAGDAARTEVSIVAGIFSFSSGTELVRSLTRAMGSFDGGINEYTNKRLLKAETLTRWYDFGHVQTYFQSRRLISTERAFNSLKFSDGAVRKSSKDTAKMEAEINWLKSAPPLIKTGVARLVEEGTDENGERFYATEYEFSPTLSEVYVFGEVGRLGWHNILRACEGFLVNCASITAPISDGSPPALYALGQGKTLRRLETFSESVGFDIDRENVLNGKRLPSLRAIANDLSEVLAANASEQSIMHGDFCFSNIIYDARARRIRVIDPRGYIQPGAPSIFGDRRYDLAKFSHSIFGRYDHILAGRYSLVREGENSFAVDFWLGETHRWLESAAADFMVNGLTLKEDAVKALEIHLFLSMLPLHHDRPDRQIAFVANALRLYAEYEGRHS